MNRVRRLGLLGVSSTICVVGAQLFACGSFSEQAVAEADAASPADAGGVPDDGPVVRFCVPHADSGLCGDFDGENEPVSFHFAGKVGNVALDRALFLSPPASMHVVANGTGAYVQGLPSSPAFARKQRLSFDTYQGATNRDASTVPTDAILARIVQGSSGCTFDLESFGDQARINLETPRVDGVSPYQNFPITAFAPPARWAHVEIALDQPEAGVKVSVAVRVDNVPALPPTPTNCMALETTASIGLGFVVGGAILPVFAEGNYDNVLFDAK